MRRVIEWAALGIELLAVAVILGAVVILAIRLVTTRYLFQMGPPEGSRRYIHQFARALLLSLELLVAADVVRTVALEPTLENVLVLGLLVVVRTFLSWSMAVEIEGCWPWERRATTGFDPKSPPAPADDF